MSKPITYAIVGCGLIGSKRAAAMQAGQLRYACDLNPERATGIADQYIGARAVTSSLQAFADPAVQAVIVATLNSSLAPLALSAIYAGKHVLVEKPGGINSAQLRTLQSAADKTGVKVRLGYNHRFHPALQKTREILDSGVLGPLMFLRGRYGHGGRTGYDREWRANPLLSGGGELIDQGVHLIDLATWFLGEFTRVDGHATTSYWDMPVDDNAFLSLRTPFGQTAWLHVSCSEWKNMFSLELYGRNGKVTVDGLGGSYGQEKCTYYKMLPQMGPPETTVWDYPAGDDSWKLELAAFEGDIRTGRAPSPGLPEAIHILEIVEEIYRVSGYPISAASL